jgi:hypothetical protein
MLLASGVIFQSSADENASSPPLENSIEVVKVSTKSKTEPEEFSLRFNYGQHSDFWKEINSLNKAEDPVAQVQRFMNKKDYGAMEGIARAKVEIKNHRQDLLNHTFDTASIGIGADGLAGGEAFNRVSPKLRGYLLWDISGGANFSQQEPRVGKSGWSYLLGSDFGVGRQKVVEGAVSDFAPVVPIKESTIYYWGPNMELGYQSQFSDFMKFRYRALFLPTFFYSPFNDKENYTIGIQKQLTTLRWRTEVEYTYAFQPVHEGGFEVGAQLLGGQQPTPLRPLPRVWDAIHKIKFFPDYGTLVGVGGVARAYTSGRKFILSGFGGFYGGYFGAGGMLNFYGLYLEGGTFGFEQTERYQFKQTRMIYGSLGYTYAW